MSSTSNSTLALALSALVVAGCNQQSSAEAIAKQTPQEPAVKVRGAPWPANDPLLESNMAKVYAHIVIADELLRKIVDPKVLDFASEGAPPEHRDEARKQIQLALARGARERLQEAIVLWKTQPVPIPNDPALTNIVDLASQLRSKEGTVIASEAIPMAQQCEACAVRLQQKFGNDPLSRP